MKFSSMSALFWHFLMTSDRYHSMLVKANRVDNGKEMAVQIDELIIAKQIN